MRLHPDAAIRVLRNEVERLAEARRSCQVDWRSANAAADTRDLAEALRQMTIARTNLAVIDQISAEMAEIDDALAILEAGFEAEQGRLPFDMAAA